MNNDAASPSLLANLEKGGDHSQIWPSANWVVLFLVWALVLKKRPCETAVAFTRLGPFMWAVPVVSFLPGVSHTAPCSPSSSSLSLYSVFPPQTPYGRQRLGMFPNGKLIINRRCEGSTVMMAESAPSLQHNVTTSYHLPRRCALMQPAAYSYALTPVSLYASRELA